jgi:hypothetical protein
LTPYSIALQPHSKLRFPLVKEPSKSKISSVIMKTRTEKWSHYRAKILRTPESKFPVRKVADRPLSPSDAAVVASTDKPGLAIGYGTIIGAKGRKKERPATPYAIYSKRKRGWLIFKLVLFVAVSSGFVAAWFLWVKG